MNYLSYFHFDNYPFMIDGTFNYFYPKNRFYRIKESLLKLCRFYSGIYIINGINGSGKSAFIKYFSDIVKNNDIPIIIKIAGRTDIFQSISSALKIDEKSINTVEEKLLKLYKNGKNIIIMIDDIQNANKDQLKNIYKLVTDLKFLRIVLCGSNMETTISEPDINRLKKYIIKRYSLKKLSFISSVKYLYFMVKSALSLNQFRCNLPFKVAFFVSFVSNGNIHVINKIMNDVYCSAFKRGTKKLELKDVFISFKVNKEVVNKNIYFKVQKLFFVLISCLSIYFVTKLVIDRSNLIEILNVKKSLQLRENKIKLDSLKTWGE